MKRLSSKLAAFMLVAVMAVSLFPLSALAEDAELPAAATEQIVGQEDGEIATAEATTPDEDPDAPAENQNEPAEDSAENQESPAVEETPVVVETPVVEEPAELVAEEPVLVENTITKQPQDAVVAPNKKAVFAVEAYGNVSSYKWQYSTNGGRTWKDYGSKKSSIMVTGSSSWWSSNNGNQYRCIVTFKNKTKVTSDVATLYVANKLSFTNPTGTNSTKAEVTVEAPAGTFPDGTNMAVSDVEADNYIDAIHEVIPDAKAAGVTAVDISFNYNGEEIEPANGNQVTVTLKSDAVNEGITLVHIDDYGNATAINAEDIVSITGGEVVFKTDAFSIYAVVARGFENNQQYVIYTGTTALAYNGNNLTTATVTVEDGTVVRSDNNNIVWTATTGWRLSYSTGTGWQATTRYLRGRDRNRLDTVTNANNDCNWTYDYYNNRLSRGNVYLSFNGTTWGTTTDVGQAATVYIALVGIEPPSGDLTYYYYNADGSASVSASETAETLTTSWTDVSTLAKEIEGYTYLEARANSKTGAIISQVNNRAYRPVGTTTGDGETLNNIYFIYMRDYIAGEDVIPGLNGPITDKDVTHNADGTFTIRLDITGVTNEVKHGANVVVVFDRTSSMSGNMSNTDRTMRVNAAISAVNTMVTTLNPGDPSVEGQYDIDFALVEFDRTAVPYDFGTDGITGHTQWTKSGTALTTRVGRYEDGENLAPSGATPGGGGTNWQAALQATAAVLENKPDADPTYVIFMTDGEPTIYLGSDSVLNNRTVNDPEYYASVPYATAIVDADYHMYDIFCSASTTTLLQSLYTTSGADSYVMAETQEAIEAAFADVANDMIDAIGSSDYSADDGVPQLGDFEIATVDGQAQLSEARYYKDGDPWTDAPVATPSAGGVKWDLSSVGTLTNGTVYSIEFDIWPSQEAYDLIADLNNQIIFYDFASYQAAGGDLPTKEAAIAAGKVITDAQHAQIDKVTDTTYTLKTNTYLKASYKLYGHTHDDDVDFTNEAMDLPTETISVKKLWPENMLDEYGEAVYRDKDGNAQTASEIKLTLQREGEDYLEFTVNKNGPDGQATGTYTDDEGVVHDATLDNWSKDDIYVSNGFMTVETVDGKKVAHIKEEGHDYQIVEPEAFLYYWDLISEVYHPMVINGEPTILVYDPDLGANDVDNENYFAIGMNKDEEGHETTPRIYKKQASASGNTLEASNYRRSNLNLTKQVPTDDPDALFTYTATVTDSYSTDGYVWFSAWDPTARDYVYDLDVTGGNVQKETKDIPQGATIDAEAGTCSWEETDGEETWTNTYPIAGDGKYYTGYFYATNGAELTIKIKAGWNVRFLNLYHGSTFSFDETGMPGNYEFDKVEADTQWDIMLESNKDWYEIDEESDTGLITGTITEPNNNYTIKYTNKPKPEFYIYHSGVAGDGNLEIIPMSAVNADGTYDLYAHTTDGTLYGGYYLDYAGKGDYADDGVKGSTGVAYTGMNYEWSTPAQNVDGTKMKPVAGETYYIKEVPTYYLRNYHQINYVKDNGKLVGLYLISAIDDLHYQESGLFLQTSVKKTSRVTSAVTYRNKATGRSVTLKANNVFKTVDGKAGITEDGEYLTYWDATNSDYFATGEFTVLPYWITPDGITVKGISTRTITISSMTRTGISKTDQ